MRSPLMLLFMLIFSYPVYAATVQEYKLNNGLKVLVKEDHRTNVATIQVWYKVGASYEHDGITGISHVLEHMMAKGTPRHPKGEFSRLIAANGGMKNATTAADFTFYRTKITADKLPLIFELEADRMQNLIFKADELTRELSVVMEERRMRTDDNPLGTLRERLRATAFLSSPYHHPVVGWPQDIKNLTIDELRQWYQQWYAPNNATLIVIGHVNPQTVFKLAKHYFGKVSPRKVPSLKPQKEMSSLGKKTLVVHYPTKTMQASFSYLTPSLKTAKKSWEPYALMLLEAIIDSSNSDLNKQLIRQQTVDYIGAEYIPYSRLDNLFTIKANSHDNPKLVTQRLGKEIKKLQTTLVTERDLQRAKKKLITERIYKLDNLTGQAKELGRLETIGLSWKVINDFERNIQSISAQQIQEIAKNYFNTNQSTVAILKPTEPLE